MFNAHLQGFANQVESLRSSGRLSGGERGALAEALLAVAGPSGPARVREVLRWLLEPVQRRWVPAPGAVSPDLDALASFGELAKGEAGGGAAGLSSRHWELFHDVQLTERCLRRSGGDHDPAERAASADEGERTAKHGASGGAGSERERDREPNLPPAGICRPVDPPPPVDECPAADHLEWALCLAEALCRATHRAWSPAHAAEAARLGLERALEMSPDECAAHLVHGPAKQFALQGGGLPPESETASSARSWLRGLRDSAYAVVAPLAVHAPGAFYLGRRRGGGVARRARRLRRARPARARARAHRGGRCSAAPRRTARGGTPRSHGPGAAHAWALGGVGAVQAGGVFGGRVRGVRGGRRRRACRRGGAGGGGRRCRARGRP